MVVFTFSVLDRKHPFWANLFQQIRIVSLSWNLIPRLIRISRIHCWRSLFLVYTKSIFFYCLCDRTEVEIWNRQLWSTRLFYFVVASASAHCFCALPLKFLNNLKPKQTFHFTWINFLLKNFKLPNPDWTFYVTWINLMLKRKTPVLESLYNKVAGLQLSCEYCKIFKNSFFIKHIRWLLLKSS